MLEDEERAKILSLYPEFVRIHGPYVRKSDKRQIVVLCDEGSKNRTTRQLAKVRLEGMLGRRLVDDETVDHNDKDCTNDAPDNLKVLSRQRNSFEGALKLMPVIFSCPDCLRTFTLSGNSLKNALSNQQAGKKGPFCSRSCAGRYGARVQKDTTATLPTIEIPRQYTR